LDAAAAAVEVDEAVDQCVEREVAPLAYPLAGVEPVADLANENVSSSYLFATESFHAETLGIRVAPVSAGALSFFMCHEVTSPHEVFRWPARLAEAECLVDYGFTFKETAEREQAADRM
jgi:hypothetical protein